jgi:hypothetical protein
MQSKKTTTFYLLAACNLAFISYLLLIGFYNHYALDDYCFISSYKKNGFHSPVTYWFSAWSARTMPLYMLNLYYVLAKWGSLLPYTMILLGVYIFAVYRLVNQLFINISKAWALQLSVLLVGFYVFNNFKFSTFYWLNVSLMYFGGILAFLLLMVQVFSAKNTFWVYLGIVFFAVFAGTSVEHQVLIFVGILFLLVLMQLIGLVQLPSKPKLYLATFIMVLGLFYMFLSPSHRARLLVMQSQGRTAVLSAGQIPIVSVQKMGLLLVEIAGLYLPFMLPVAVVLAYCLPNFKPNQTITNLLAKVKFWQISLLVFGIIYVSILPGIYVFGGIGPQRILTLMNMLIIIYVVLTILYFKQKSINYKYPPKAIVYVAMLLILSNLLFRIATGYPVLKRYAHNELHRRSLMYAMDKNTSKPILMPNATPVVVPTFTQYFAEYVYDLIGKKGNLPFYETIQTEILQPNKVDVLDKELNEGCYCDGLGLPNKINIKIDAK